MLRLDHCGTLPRPAPAAPAWAHRLPTPPRAARRAAALSTALSAAFFAALPASLAALLLALLLALAPASALRAQGVELATLQLARAEGALTLEFAARITLPKAAEEALYRGVPLYFVAEASLYRNRWYWRDDRIARVIRSWRVAYQPLTGTWRVGLGGLNQTFQTLAEALSSASRSAGWRLIELRELEGGSHYVEFSYRLDTSQLPGPMQFGFTGQGDWSVGVARSLRVEGGAP